MASSVLVVLTRILAVSCMIWSVMAFVSLAMPMATLSCTLIWEKALPLAATRIAMAVRMFRVMRILRSLGGGAGCGESGFELGRADAAEGDRQGF